MDRHRKAPDDWWVLLIAALLGLVLFLLSSCGNTVQAVRDLPEGWWIHTENVVVAIGVDVWNTLKTIWDLLL